MSASPANDHILGTQAIAHPPAGLAPAPQREAAQPPPPSPPLSPPPPLPHLLWELSLLMQRHFHGASTFRREQPLLHASELAAAVSHGQSAAHAEVITPWGTSSPTVASALSGQVFMHHLRTLINQQVLPADAYAGNAPREASASRGHHSWL